MLRPFQLSINYTSSFKFFSFKTEFVIHLEKSVNNIPLLRTNDFADKIYIERPKRKRNLYQKVWNLLYFGGKIDTVDGESGENGSEHEIEIALEDRMEKAIEHRLENLRSRLIVELKGIREQGKRGRDILAGKIDMIMFKLSEMENNT